MLEDNFIPIPDFSQRFAPFTSIYAPPINHPENAPCEADSYQALYEKLVRERVNVHYVKPHEHGMTYKIADGYSDMKKPEYRATLKLEFQGKFVAAAVRYPSDRQYVRSKRGAVSDFSAGSRRRMFDMFHRFAITRKPVFLTLTYGDEYPDVKTAKNHLRALFERIRRKYPDDNVSGIWRMEFQERGAPHFHIIFFNLPFWKKENVQAVWGQITKQNRPFTRIEMIRSHKAMMGYVSKYCAKVQPSGDSGFNSLTYLHAYRAKHGDYVGRMWGKFNAENLPYAPKITLERDFIPAQFYKFHSLAENVFPQIKDYISPGFRIYVKDAVRWEKIARYLFDPPTKAGQYLDNRVPLSL